MNSLVHMHPVCELNLQRRIHEARQESIANAVARNKKRSLLDRLLRRHPIAPPMSLNADHLRPGSEDVWKSLRF